MKLALAREIPSELKLKMRSCKLNYWTDASPAKSHASYQYVYKLNISI